MLGLDKPARKLGSLAYSRVSSNTLDWYTVAANYSVPAGKSCLILDRHSTDTCSTLEQHSINLATNMLIDSRLRCRPIHWSTHDLKALPSKLSPWTANKNCSISRLPSSRKIASQYLQGLICRGRYSVTVKVGNGIRVQVTQWYEPYRNIKGHSGPPCWKAWKNEWYKKRLLLFISMASSLAFCSHLNSCKLIIYHRVKL